LRFYDWFRETVLQICRSSSERQRTPAGQHKCGGLPGIQSQSLF
jgi:hypothetical protein